MGYHNWKIYFGPSADSNSRCLDQKTPVLINCAIQAQKNSGGILRSFYRESSGEILRSFYRESLCIYNYVYIIMYLDVSVEKGGTGFLTSIYRKPTFTGQYIRWNSFSPKARKINLIKTLVHRALMICSKTKLDSELDTIKQLLIDNGYPEDVLVSCIKEKLANISSEKWFGPEKCPVYLKLPWIGNVSSKFENQINKAITSCFYAVKPRAVYNTRVMLPSAKKDSVPTTQKSCVVYEFSCRCEARYVGRTTQRLADRIKQHVPTSIRTKNTTTREQPPRTCKNSNSKMKSDSAIGQHLLTNPECAKTYTDDNFRIIGQARSSFHLGVLESVYIKTQNPVLCKQKEFVFSLGLFK